MTVSSIDVLIGRRLCDARARAGMDVQQAAARLSITADELGSIERGDSRARASFIYEATRTYGLGLADLFRAPEAHNDR